MVGWREPSCYIPHSECSMIATFNAPKKKPYHATLWREGTNEFPVIRTCPAIQHQTNTPIVFRKSFLNLPSCCLRRNFQKTGHGTTARQFMPWKPATEKVSKNKIVELVKRPVA